MATPLQMIYLKGWDDMPATWELLLIEDNTIDAMILVNHMAELPFRIHRAESMGEAYERLTDHQVDLAILDLGLPDVEEGKPLEALRQFRRFAPDLPVLVISANDGEALAEKLGELGGEDWIQKGRVNRENLRRILYTMTGKILRQRQNQDVQTAMHKANSALDMIEETLKSMTRKVAASGD